MAYWGGIVDGEAQITISHIRCGRDRYLYHRVYVRIGNTSEDLMNALKEHFGGSVTLTRLHKRRPRCKPVHMWTIACRKAMHFLEGILPFLIIKRKHAEVAIECQRTFHGAGRGYYRLSDSLFATRERLRDKLLALNKRGMP